jgi:DNA-binding CsgD family transcriptional regulator
MTREEAREIVEHLWGRPISLEEIEQLLVLGDGVPFFIEELAQQRPRESKASVPNSVSHVLAARLANLGHEAVLVIRTASLMRGAIDPVILAGATGFNRDVVSSSLIEAARAGVIADTNGRLSFRHALVRDGVASQLLSLEAADLHRKLARAIETSYSDELVSHSISLAHHYRAAGEAAVASKYSVLAGRQLLALAATAEARAWFDAAIELTGDSSTEATAGLAEVEFREGREKEAAALFRAVAETHRTRGDLNAAAHALGRLAWASLGSSDGDEVMSILDDGLRLLEHEKGSREYTRLLIQKGNMLIFLLNRPDDAKAILSQAADLARRVGEKALVAEALDGLAYVARAEEAWQPALRLSEEATSSARASNDSEAVGRTHTNRAVVLAVVGQTEQALQVLEVARNLLLKGHGRAGVAVLDVNRAWVCRLMGLPHEVATLAAQGHAAWRQWSAFRKVLEVWAALERGEVSLAKSVTDTTWEDMGGDAFREATLQSPSTAKRDASLVLQCEAMLLVASGPTDHAVQTCRALVEVDRHSNERFDLGQSLVLFAKSLIRAEQLQEAKSICAQVEEVAQPYPYLLAAAHEVKGMLDVGVGQSANEFLQAAERFAACENSSDQARCRRLAAEALLVQDVTANHEQAVGQLRLARELGGGAGAVVEVNKAEAVLRSLGIRPRAGRPRGRKSVTSGLSARESEVAVLVAAGDTNGAIAEQLFLSERTVQDHITHSLRKLELSGRAALASWAVKHGMI